MTGFNTTNRIAFPDEPQHLGFELESRVPLMIETFSDERRKLSSISHVVSR